MGALISGFSFDVDMRSVLLFWVIAAVALSSLTAFWREEVVFILIIPIVVMFILRAPEIIRGAKWVANGITAEYGKWLTTPVLFRGAYAARHETMLFFAFAGIVLAFILSITICLQHSALLTIMCTVPFVFLTVVLVETTPDIPYLIGLIIVYLSLAISRSMHPFNYGMRGRGVFAALALSMVLAGIAYLAAPPDRYRRSDYIDSIDNYLRNTAEKIGFGLNKKGIGWPDAYFVQWRFNTDYVGVADAGSRLITDKKLLEVVSSQPGTFYLRGFSMKSFDGREWRVNCDTQAQSVEILAKTMPAMIAEEYSRLYPDKAPKHVSITVTRAGDTTNVIYQPYYSMHEPQEKTNSYTIDFYDPKANILKMRDEISTEIPVYTLFLTNYDAQTNIQSVYTQIERSTAEGLRQLALDAGIDPDADRAKIADMVAEYISSSARYTLTPYIIPDGEDFALHFLKVAQRGYCIHFATAATLMLRALGIPARFTSGFVVTVPTDKIGKPVVITDRAAHAWVEVYYDDIGWIPLEATPARSGTGVPDRVSHVAPGSSAPPIDVSGSPDNTEKPQMPYDPGNDPDDNSPLPASTAKPGPGTEKDKQEPLSPVKPGVYILLIVSFIVVCFIAITLRYMITRKYRKRRLEQPDTNAAVIYAWSYIINLCKPEKPPKEIEALAMKARFSQHLISEEERDKMIESITAIASEKYQQKSFFGRLRQKYILAL